MEKYIFLDIDGVLNHEEWFEKKHKDYKSGKDAYDSVMFWFDPECVRRINEVIDNTGAKIVVSSSWRFDKELSETFKKVGLPTDFDVTPATSERHRGKEIDLYLSEVKGAYSYCILDDDNDILKKQRNNFVHTANERYKKNLFNLNGGTGFTEECKDKAIKILNGKTYGTCKD